MKNRLVFSFISLRFSERKRLAPPAGYFFGFYTYIVRRATDHHLRNGVRSKLVAISVKILHLAVIRPLVRDVKRRRDRTAIGIPAAVFEQLGVQLSVEIVDGVVESQQHYLRYLLR